MLRSPILALRSPTTPMLSFRSVLVPSCHPLVAKMTLLLASSLDVCVDSVALDCIHKLSRRSARQAAVRMPVQPADHNGPWDADVAEPCKSYLIDVDIRGMFAKMWGLFLLVDP